MSEIRRFFNKYPWLFGYLISPIAFFISSRQSTNVVNFYPLLSHFYIFSSDNVLIYKTLLSSAWYLHFGRRAVEVIFVNSYTGVQVPEPRDSVLEFFYYLLWGALNGLCCTDTALYTNGSPPVEVIYVGAAIFLIGEVGNCYCHWKLRKLRPRHSTEYFLPSDFPFNVIITPHYFFELLSWIGFSLASGFNSPSIFILVVSVLILVPMAKRRQRRYIRMYKEISNSNDYKGSNPGNRWIIFPPLY